VKTFIVLLAVPFSLVGAFWLLYLLGYNMSVAVWVGLIALAGLDAETGCRHAALSRSRLGKIPRRRPDEQFARLA
jgi:Cu/Ag efflux pump CusA